MRCSSHAVSHVDTYAIKQYLPTNKLVWPSHLGKRGSQKSKVLSERHAGTTRKSRTSCFSGGRVVVARGTNVLRLLFAVVQGFSYASSVPSPHKRKANMSARQLT
eukprot:50786-Amphidinium_carterae.1